MFEELSLKLKRFSEIASFAQESEENILKAVQKIDIDEVIPQDIEVSSQECEEAQKTLVDFVKEKLLFGVEECEDNAFDYCFMRDSKKISEDIQGIMERIIFGGVESLKLAEYPSETKMFFAIAYYIYLKECKIESYQILCLRSLCYLGNIAGEDSQICLFVLDTFSKIRNDSEMCFAIYHEVGNLINMGENRLAILTLDQGPENGDPPDKY